TLVAFLLALGERRGGPRDRRSLLLLGLQPQSLEPIAQLQSGEAVVAIVGPDGLANFCGETLGLLLRDGVFDRAEMPGHLSEVDFTSQAVEWFEHLYGVALDPSPKRFSDNAIKVYEDSGAQQLVEYVCPGAVSSHEPLHRGRLVRRVVEDMHPRVQLATFDNDIDQPLEGTLLFDRRHRPERLIVAAAIGIAD